MIVITEYLEPNLKSYQTSMMKLTAKIVNRF